MFRNLLIFFDDVIGNVRASGGIGDLAYERGSRRVLRSNYLFLDASVSSIFIINYY